MGTEQQETSKREVPEIIRNRRGFLPPILVLIIGVALFALAHVLLPGWFKGLPEVLFLALMMIGALVYFFQSHQLLIGQHRKENQRINEQLRIYNHLTAGLQNPIIVTDIENRVLFWNPAAAAFYGYPLEEALGKSADQLLGRSAADRLYEQEIFRAALENGEYDGEREQPGDAGSSRWVSTHITLVRDNASYPAVLVREDRDITHHKHVEFAVQESEKQFDKMFSGSHAMMLLIDPEYGRIVDINPAACDFYGYSREEMLTMKHRDITAATGEEAKLHLAHIVENGWDHYSTRHRLASGEIRDIEVYCAPYYVKGQMMILPIIHDITEQRKTALALHEAERRLWAIMKNVHLLSVIVNQQGIITFANDYMAQLCGWKRDEIIGKSWDLFAPEETIEDYLAEFQRILAGNESSLYVELPILIRPGERRTIAFNLIPLRDLDGEINEMAALGADITERVRAEQDMERRVKELSALQQAGRFTTTNPNMKDVLAGIASAARLLLGSQTALIMLHQPKQQELELVAFDGEPVQPLDQSIKQEPLVVGDRIPDKTGVAGWVLNQHQPVLVADLRKELGFEQDRKVPPQSLIVVPMIYQNRIIGVFEVNNSTLGAFSGRDLPVLSMLADFATMVVINARLLEKEQQQLHMLEESQARLIQSEKLNAMGRMVATLAHEINNPLQSLRSGISLLREQPLSEQKKREYLDMAYREVERLNRTTNQILGFYRSPGQHQIPVNLNQVLDEILSLVEKQLEVAKVTVCRDYSPNLPYVDGFPDQLRQVFLNLILNGTASMPEGGQLTLKTSRDTEANLVRVAVQDTGKGITPEDLSKIFEPFYTTRKDGSGLGLSISHNLVEKHRGRIEVQSLPQLGTTFTVVLPAHMNDSPGSTAEHLPVNDRKGPA